MANLNKIYLIDKVRFDKITKEANSFYFIKDTGDFYVGDDQKCTIAIDYDTTKGTINETFNLLKASDLTLQSNIDTEKNERIYSDNNLKNSIANLNAIVHATVAQTVEETYNASDYEGVPATLNVNAVDYPVIDKSNVGISELWGRSKKSDNLLVLSDIASTTVNGITYSVKNGVITINGTATGLVTIALGTLFYGANTYSFSAFNTATTATGTIRILQALENGAWQFNNVISLNTSNANLPNYTTTEKLSYFIDIESGAVISNLVIKPMLVLGSTAPTNFIQGFKKSLTIPTAIQALPNYGVGLSNTDKSLCNYIDFTNKKYIQNISNRAYTEGDTDSDTMLTDNTTTYYKLTTPIETDISGYLTDDFIFPIETGGVIILNNANTDFNVKSSFLTEYEIKFWQNT